MHASETRLRDDVDLALQRRISQTSFGPDSFSVSSTTLAEIVELRRDILEMCDALDAKLGSS